MRTDITLRGTDTEWFEEVREDMAEHRPDKPSRNETIRRLMEHYEEHNMRR